MWAGGERNEKPRWALRTSGAQALAPQSSLRLAAPREERARRRVRLSLAQSMTEGGSLIPISFRAAHSHVSRAGGGMNARAAAGDCTRKGI